MSTPLASSSPNPISGLRRRSPSGSLGVFALKRVGQSLITVFVVLTVVFLLMRLLPIEGYFGDEYDRLTPEQREARLEAMGLLDPVHIQLKNFYLALSRGDLGTSIIFRPHVVASHAIWRGVSHRQWHEKSCVNLPT